MHTRSHFAAPLAITLLCAALSTSCSTGPTEPEANPDDRPEFGLVVPLSEEHLPKSGGLIQAVDLDPEEKKKKDAQENPHGNAESPTEETTNEEPAESAESPTETPSE